MKKNENIEIEKLENLPILVLGASAHNGLDWVHSLLDGNKEIIILPAFSYFRFLDRENINQNLFYNKKKFCYFITKILFEKKSYNVPRRKFFDNNNEKKKFQIFLNKFFLLKKINYKNLFYGIHYAFVKAKKINVSQKKIIISHEHMTWNHSRYLIFKKIKFAFVIRDPRAAFAGSILQMKKFNKIDYLDSNQMNKILLNFIFGWKFIKNQKKKNLKNIYFFINESMNKNLIKEIKKFCKWCNLTYSYKMLIPTFNNKKWKGESSYLMENKIDLDKEVPKNFYNAKNVKQRWIEQLNISDIITIEAFCYDYMSFFGYKKIYIKKYFQKFLNFYKIIFFHTKPNLALGKKYIIQYLKNLIKRFFVVLFSKKSIRLFLIK